MALNLATDSRMGKNKTAQTIAVSKDKPINLLLHTMLWTNKILHYMHSDQVTKYYITIHNNF